MRCRWRGRETSSRSILEPGFDEAYSTLWKHFKSEINVSGAATR